MNYNKEKNNYDHKFSEMREHMFYSETLERLSRYIPEERKCEDKSIRGLRRGVVAAGLVLQKSTLNTELNKSFLYTHRDKLFWSFYIAINGIDTFKNIGQHMYSEEKKIKFESIVIMRTKLAQFKAAKISLNQAENEMINLKEITLLGLEALCIAYDVRLVYIVGETYYDFNYGEKYYLIERVDKGCSIIFDNIKTKIDNASQTLFLMNQRKPLKGISSYVIAELLEIAKKINIQTINDKGKPLLKKQLYEAIVLKTGKLQQMV